MAGNGCPPLGAKSQPEDRLILWLARHIGEMDAYEGNEEIKTAVCRASGKDARKPRLLWDSSFEENFKNFGI